MSDARERLETWASGLTPGNVVSREAAEQALDAFLSHPDDLLAMLVETGALERVGWYADEWGGSFTTSEHSARARFDYPLPVYCPHGRAPFREGNE